MSTADLMPPGLPWWRRLLLRAKLRRGDWRLRLATAAVLVALGLVTAIVAIVVGVSSVLDKLTDRADVTDCINERQAEWNVVVGDILLSISPPPGIQVQTSEQLRTRMEAANEAIRTRDLPVGQGGCIR
jgi:hypothetical protein